MPGERSEERIEDLLLAADRVMTDILAESLMAEGFGGVTLHQFRLLDLVRGGVSRPGEIARHLKVTPPSISSMTERLEGMGLLLRLLSRDDRRAVVLELTPQGKDMVSRVNAKRRRLLRRVLGDMEKGDAERMRQGLSSFLEAHRRQQERGA